MPLDLPAPDGVPWLVWLLAIIAAPLLGAIASITVALITRRDTKAELADARDRLAEAKVGVDRTLDQVANTHDTNLREDLDDKFAELGGRLDQINSGLEGVRTDVGGLHSETRDLRSDVAGIRTDARRDRRALTQQRADLQSHIDDVPGVIEAALAKVPPMIKAEITRHGHDCNR